MTSPETEKMLRLENETRRLQRAVEELSIINEIAIAITSTQSLDKIVDLIVQKCVKHLKVEQAAVMLLNKKGEERQFRTMIRKGDTASEILPFRLDQQLTGWMLKHQTPLLINDFPSDDRFSTESDGVFPIVSLLSVPLTLKGRMIGLLATFNKKTKEGYSSDDQRLLSIIAAQSTQVIENARLYEEEQKLLRMNEQVRLASEIQLGLLPKTSPQIEGYDITGISYPAQVVGGDYFDFIPEEKNRLAVCLGDVCGKGLPAALLMASLQATIRGQVLLKPHPKDCLGRSNQLLFQSTTRTKFATLFYGILDSRKHQMTYANAGHNRPILFRAGEKPRVFDTTGVALSLMENSQYEESIIDFHPGELLLIYSDGLTEAMNEMNEEYGEERLVEVVNRHFLKSSEELTEVIVQSVKKFAGNRIQSDDITLVLIKRIN